MWLVTGMTGIVVSVLISSTSVVRRVQLAPIVVRPIISTMSKKSTILTSYLSDYGTIKTSGRFPG